MAQNPRAKITTGDVRLARDLICSHLKPLKERLIERLVAGDRDWSGLRNLLEQIIDYQTAVDALGYTTSIEDRA